MPAVFLTNLMLQQWSDQGKVRLEDNTLTLLAEGRTVKLTPAVRFTKLIDGGDDPNKLLGKVKTKGQLAELGAEHYLDSVLFGDVGYTVVEGFLGDLSPAVKKPGAPAADPTTDTIKLVAPRAASRAPTPVDLPPPPASAPVAGAPTPTGVETLSEAEALSQLFLSTVRDK